MSRLLSQTRAWARIDVNLSNQFRRTPTETSATMGTPFKATENALFRRGRDNDSLFGERDGMPDVSPSVFDAFAEAEPPTRDGRHASPRGLEDQRRPEFKAMSVLLLCSFLTSNSLTAGGAPLPHPDTGRLKQSVFPDWQRKLPECRPTVPPSDPAFTIVSVDGAVVTHETNVAIREGFFAARLRLEKWWLRPEDFVFIAHPIEISQPQTGFWCGDGIELWCGGYYEYRFEYQEFGKPEIHFVSDFLNPARVRALVDHEAAHGIAHLAGCPNWYTIGHDGTDVCL